MKKHKSITLSLLALLGLMLTTASGHPAQEESRQSPANKTASASANAVCYAHVKVIGAVRAPLRLELRRRVRLLEALAIVGGPTERAGKLVQITHAAPGSSDCDRPASGELEKSSAGGVETLLLAGVAGGDERANPYLRHGDTVSVAEVGVAYIVGSVLNPQPIILSEPVTVTQAIARAGGISPGAEDVKVYIYRHGPEDAAQTGIRVDLKAVRKGRAEDLLLQPYDVVEVRERRAHGRPIRFPDTPPQPVAELPLRVVY
jgi:protein involved in polysaccharide export with SLBB domain